MAIRYLSGVNIDSNTLVVDDANNRVGIGTASPTYTFDIVNTSSPTFRITRSGATDFRIGASILSSGALLGTYSNSPLQFLTNSTTQAVITEAGNVGIGTTSPGHKLDVEGNIRAKSGTYYIGTTATNYLSSDGANVYLRTNAVHYFEGNGFQKGAWNSSGNLGIGTISPNEKLSLAGSTGTTFGLSLEPSGWNSSKHRFTVPVSGDTSMWSFNYNGSVVDSSLYATSSIQIGQGAILFSTGGTNTAPSEKMRVTSSGNVGIANSSPITKFTVGAYEGSRLPYINGTANTFNADGITVTSYNTANAGIGGGLDLTNNVYSVGSFSPLISFSSKTLSGSYNNNYAAIYGILAGDSGDGNWNSGHLVFATALAYGASEKMRITNAGNVGIGTTSPATKLQVNGTFASNSLWTDSGAVSYWGNYSTAYGGLTWDTGYATVFATAGNSLRFGSNGASPDMVIDTSGNVGIGTTSPGAKLDIAQTGGTQLRIVSGDAYGSADVQIELVSANDYRGRGIFYKNSTDSNQWFSGVPYTGGSYSIGYHTSQPEYLANSKFFINTSGNVGIGTTSPGAKLVIVGGDDAAGVGVLEIQTAGGTNLKIGGNSTYSWIQSHSSKPLYINQLGNNVILNSGGGNVGIGTTSPGAKLDVNGAQVIQSAAGFGTDGDQAALFFSNTSNYGLSGNFGGYSRNLIKSDGTSLLTIGRRNTSLIGELSIESGSSGIIKLFAGGSERMRITSAGNVGIGTTSPSEKLHVDGNIVITYNNSYQGINSIGNKAILARVSPTTGIINYAEYATAANLNGFVIGSDDARVKGNIATDSLEFITNTSTRMFINSSGNVGIGTTSPARNLHVAGDVQFNDQGAIPAGQYVPDGAYGIDNLITNGAENVALGKPDVWLRIYVDGVAFVFPGYTE